MKPLGNICQGSGGAGFIHCFNFLLGLSRNLASSGVEPSPTSLLCCHPACPALPRELLPTLVSSATSFFGIYFSFPGQETSCLSVSGAPRLAAIQAHSSPGILGCGTAGLLQEVEPGATFLWLPDTPYLHPYVPLPQ